jgi:hypothetical protein
MDLGEYRFKKADDYETLLKNRLVWLGKSYLVFSNGKGKPFGKVTKDSYWPDMWVSVEVWDKYQFAEWHNRNVPKAITKNLNRRIRNHDHTARGPRV